MYVILYRVKDNESWSVYSASHDGLYDDFRDARNDAEEAKAEKPDWDVQIFEQYWEAD